MNFVLHPVKLWTAILDWCRLRLGTTAATGNDDRGRGRFDGSRNGKRPLLGDGDFDSDDDWGDWGEPRVQPDWVAEAEAARRNGKPGREPARRRGRWAVW